MGGPKRNLQPALIVHGGAGRLRRKRDLPRYLGEIERAVGEGLNALRKGSSLEAVQAAVESMEDSGAFNAGRGSTVARDGRMQLDAAMMVGRGLRAGGVGACACTYHPTRLARFVMEKTKHILIVGEDCERIARSAGTRVEELRPTEEVLKRYRSSTRVPLVQPGHGTVGAVAIDRAGVPAAAVSTGGTWLKLPGRVGDSAVVGAGIYADEATGAACATGIGEEIMKNALSWEACITMKRWSAKVAARKAIELITRRSGSDTAGIITVDRFGRVGFAHNTLTMGRGWFDNVREKVVVEL